MYSCVNWWFYLRTNGNLYLVSTVTEWPVRRHPLQTLLIYYGHTLWSSFLFYNLKMCILRVKHNLWMLSET